TSFAGLGKASGELDGAVEIAGEVVSNVHERAGGIDGAQPILGAPGTDGIEVLEPQTNGIHQLMAIGAGRVRAVLCKALTRGGRRTRSGWRVVHVCGGRFDGLTQQVL